MRFLPVRLHALLHTLLVVAVLLIIGVLLTGCSDPHAARDDGTAPPLPAATDPQGKNLKAKHVYSRAQLRTALLRTHTAPVTDNLDVVRNAVRNCRSCLEDRKLIQVDRTVFQQAAVRIRKDKRPFAVVLYSTDRTRPHVKLIVTGSDVSAAHGRNNTLVIQESIFGKGDKSCCASTWAVTVYRLTDGRFDAGQRIMHTTAPTLHTTAPDPGAVQNHTTPAVHP